MRLVSDCQHQMSDVWGRPYWMFQAKLKELSQLTQHGAEPPSWAQPIHRLLSSNTLLFFNKKFSSLSVLSYVTIDN